MTDTLDVTHPLPPIGERRVRNFIVVFVVAMTVISSIWWTDDAWPFAPFHMFATTTRPNGTVRKLEFRVDTVDGRRLHLDASAFDLRRAEAEGMVSMRPLNGVPTRCLSAADMAALAEQYNRRHAGRDRITKLDQVWLIRFLKDGRLVRKESRIAQSWPTPNTDRCLK